MMKIHMKPIELTGSFGIEVPPQYTHFARPRIFRIRMDPVLGRCMLVAQHSRWHTRDWILCCGDAVALVRLLREISHGRIADPGRAIAVEFEVIGQPRSLISNVSCSKDGFCASEIMTDDGDAVVGAFAMESYEEFYDGLADTSPEFPRAVVDLAAFAEFGDVDFFSFEIFGPVFWGTNAAEGKDNELAHVGNGDET